MPPPYKTPREAVLGLIEAYRTLDVDEIVRNKDFDIDARLFFEGLGLPITREQLAEGGAVFEGNFRRQMEEGIPDYGSADMRIVSEEQAQPDFSIITVASSTAEDQKFELRVLVYHTSNGWKVVLHPKFDHF